MPAPIDFSVFVAAMEASGLPYCVTGSVASGIHGEPRLTVGIDFVLLLRVADIGKLRAVFPEDHYYVPPVEILIAEAQRGERGMFNLMHHEGMLKAGVFVAARDPLHHWALKHRRRAPLSNGIEIWVAPPEYVILRKLDYYREGGRQKHLRDIRFMLACTDVDRSFIEEHVARLGLAAQWAESQLPERS
jgi:hypothetical protein